MWIELRYEASQFNMSTSSCNVSLMLVLEWRPSGELWNLLLNPFCGDGKIVLKMSW